MAALRRLSLRCCSPAARPRTATPNALCCHETDSNVDTCTAVFVVLAEYYRIGIDTYQPCFYPEKSKFEGIAL
jgi:hypothetical protein